MDRLMVQCRHRSCRGHRAEILINNSLSFVGFGIAIISALLQILEILSQCKQEKRKSCNQDFKAAPAWTISSGQMESEPGALPGFKC